MPRRNNRDKKYEPKDYDNSNSGSYSSTLPDKQKPIRRRKGKRDKKIYKPGDDVGY